VELVEHLERLFAWDDWANREALASLQRCDPAPPRSLRFLAHIVAAERLWLARMKQEPQPMAVWPELSLRQCATELQALRPLWDERIAGLGPAGLEQPVPYTNSKGERWSSRVEDILLHVVTHSAYHRGQIAADVRASGQTPPYTDFIHCVRQGLLE
jgi:uncharacterized damage-inducible protein DinB